MTRVRDYRTFLPIVKPSTPHDALFKKTFGDPIHAQGQLKALLPARLATQIDWKTLQVIPGSFVDDQLAASHSDLLYRVQLQGKEAFLLLLFEHQSTDDPWMSFRLLCYMVRIWTSWLENNPTNISQKLPAIIPMVLFHGKKAWSYSCEFADLLNLDDTLREDLAEYLPRFRFILDDLSEVSDDTLQKRALTSETLLSLAILRSVRYLTELNGFLHHWGPVFRELVAKEKDPQSLSYLVYYLLRVGPEDKPTLEKMMEQCIGETGRKAVKTAGELLIEEGIQRGVQQGEVKARIECILSLLQERNVTIFPKDRKRIVACNDIDTLDRWFRRSMQAKNVQELFDS